MNEKKEKYTAVVLAAGKGTRMGGSVAKQFLEIGGKPVVVYALEVFEHSPEIDQIILVTGADKIEYCHKEIIEKYGIKKTVSVCAGGRERYESVWKALQTLKSLESEQEQKTDYVLIHDGARPFLNQEMLERLCACVKEEKACVLGIPNGFSGGIYKGMRVAPGKAASGTPSATSPSPVFAPSNDGTSITATFSGFNVTVNYHLRASKQNSSQNPNDYSYGDAYSSYTFTNQTVSRTHSR